MAKRSLQASQEGARLARKAFDRKGWTQENLAAELELKTRQPIWRFFTCRPVERHIFVEVCHILDLNWWEIAEHPPEFLLDMVKDQQEPPFPPSDTKPEAKVDTSVTLLVEQIRANCQDWIENQCGVLRVLDTCSPAYFDALYVPVDIVQKFSEYTHLEAFDPQVRCQTGLHSQRIDLPKRQSGSASQSRIPALQLAQQKQKLRVLGQPGSGKTELLKYLALQCIRGLYGRDRVPVIIHLDDFATYSQEIGKYSLFDFLCYELSGHGINDAQTIITLLTEGRFLLLLDALDEVIEANSYAVYKEITRFVERYYKNQFVITTRPASDRFEFSQFTDVEIGAFTDEQVSALSDKWFKFFSNTAGLEVKAAAQFLQQLRLQENQSIADLARVPLLFNSIAQLFQERGDLATNHLEIYETCLNILFERWDRSRGVNRSFSKPDIPVTIKQAVLTQLAAIGFEQHRSWFERREIMQWIEEYLYRLHPEAVTPTVAQAMSKTLFAALEHDHGLLVEQTQGIFSFSFPGFQSYFTARWIVSGENSEGAMVAIKHHASAPQWQEVVLLSCTLAPADERVTGAVKQALNQLIAQHPDLASFVDWARQISLKSLMHQQLRASFVLWQLMLRTPSLLERYASVLPVLHALAQQLLLEILLDNLFKSVLEFTPENLTELGKWTSLLDRAIALSDRAGYEVEFHALQSLKRKLPDLNQPYSQLLNWWQTSSSTWADMWTDQLRQVLADWYEDDQYKYLTPGQQQMLGRYTYLNQMLSDCLSLQSTRQNASDSNFPYGMSTCSTYTQKTLSIAPRFGVNPSSFSLEGCCSTSETSDRSVQCPP